MHGQALICPSCGAPAQPHEDQRLLRCHYCQRTFEIPNAAPPPPPQAPVMHVNIVLPGGDVVTPPAIDAMRAARVARASSRVGCFSALVPLLIVGGVTLSVLRANGVWAKGWDGDEPLSCTGNDHVEASDVTVTYGSGQAISVTGNCSFKCTRCKIKAPIAIQATGNGHVTMVDSQVTGTVVGVDANGNADVRIIGNSTFSGRIGRGGNAQVTTPPTPGAPPVITTTTARKTTTEPLR